MPMSIMKQQISNKIFNHQIPSFDELASYGEFFIDNYGFDKIKQLILSPGNYQEIYGKSEEELWGEWVEYLKENNI